MTPVNASPVPIQQYGSNKRELSIIIIATTITGFHPFQVHIMHLLSAFKVLHPAIVDERVNTLEVLSCSW